jgi:hypothetical protein
MLPATWSKYVLLLGLVVTLSACHGNPAGPECAFEDTGDLVLVNLSDSGAPRDLYVDGRFVTTLPYGNQAVVTADAGVIHTVEWVSTISGNTRDVTRVAVDQCTTTTLNNHF